MTVGRDWLEAAVNRSWYGGAGWTYLFVPLIPFVALVAWWRFRIRPKTRFAALGAPIIVIGGLTAGGTGKTPTLIALARYLSGRGFKVGVVSRGYGRVAGQSSLLVEVDHTADKVGDEPLLIKQSVNKAAVVVGDSRLDAARSLCREHGVSVVLADDGLQHYELPRDFEVVVVDAHRRFGNRWLIPVGPLREPLSRLQSVDYVLERNGNNPSRSFVYIPNGFARVGGGPNMAVSEAQEKWQGKKIVAATGLGQPSQFFAMLRELNLTFEAVSIADHGKLDLSAIQADFQADIVIVTAKDAVKLGGESCDNVWVFEIEAELPSPLYAAVEQRLGQMTK